MWNTQQNNVKNAQAEFIGMEQEETKGNVPDSERLHTTRVYERP